MSAQLMMQALAIGKMREEGECEVDQAWNMSWVGLSVERRQAIVSFINSAFVSSSTKHSPALPTCR